MKKLISLRLDERLLNELDKEVEFISQKNKTPFKRTWAIESAITMWINYQRDRRKGKFVQIGVDEDGMPVYGIRPEQNEKD